MSKLDQVLQQFRSEIGPDFVSTDVVGVSDGISVGGGSMNQDFNAMEASARFAMVMKLAGKVSDKLGLGAVDDNLVTTDRAYILARFLGDHSYYWGVAVTKDATLGMVRMLMGQYATELWDALPH